MMIFGYSNSVHRKGVVMASGLASRHVIEMECCVGSISLEKFHVTGKLPG